MDDFELKLPNDVEKCMSKGIIKDFYKRRYIILTDGIEDNVIPTVMLYILKWNTEDVTIPIAERTPITIILNSYGGDKTLGMGLLDTIRYSETPVRCLIVSMAASMASYIPMVCSETYAYPNAVVCLHDGYTGIMQTTRKADDTFKFFQACDERLDEIILNYTNIDEMLLEEIADREYYMFADQAQELGIVDKIIGVDCMLEEVLL